MAKTETYKIRLSKEEREAFNIAAELTGLRLAPWMLERLRKSARQELQEAGRKVPFDKIIKKH